MFRARVKSKLLPTICWTTPLAMSSLAERTAPASHDSSSDDPASAPIAKNAAETGGGQDTPALAIERVLQARHAFRVGTGQLVQHD